MKKRGVFQNKLYDGIPQLLKKLKKEGKTLSVATSKPEFFAEKILKIYNIEKYFDFVAGANMDETRSKNPTLSPTRLTVSESHRKKES